MVRAGSSDSDFQVRSGSGDFGDLLRIVLFDSKSNGHTGFLPDPDHLLVSSRVCIVGFLPLGELYFPSSQDG